MYRLLADVFNDVAMVLDCASPVLSEGAVAAFGGVVAQGVKVGVLASSSVLRALCGVAAGSAKGCLSTHFARRGNLGEVNAKDSAQETVVSLVGTLTGTLVVSYVTGAWATWGLLLVLLVLHLGMNWMAVRAVCMRSLNRQRASLVVCELVEMGRVLTPEEVSERERIFERTDLLRWKEKVVGYVRFAATVDALVNNIARKDRASGAYHDISTSLIQLQSIFEQEPYILSWNEHSRGAVVVLKRQADNQDKLKAWANALILAKFYDANFEISENEDASKDALRVKAALEQTCSLFNGDVLVKMCSAGWDLQVAALELRPSSTIA